jgi:glycosyltransferase involved in cell wall biosynthesis
MNKTQKQIERKRTLQDRLISGFNSARFSITEPIGLKLARLRYEKSYNTLDENPLISVCIPTYNRGQILVDTALPSVFAQTYKNIEVIVIGHHCTDDTEQLISKIKDPRLFFYNMPSRKLKYPPTVENHWFVGGAVPTNLALQKAKGKWIARIDDDVIWTEDHLEKLLNFAQKGNLEFVSASHKEERSGVKKIIDSKNDKPRIGSVQTWLYRSYLTFIKHNPNCWRKHWNKVWDTDIRDRFYKAGTRMGYLDEVLAFVIPRPGEKTVGLDAYKFSEKENLEKYKEI